MKLNKHLKFIVLESLNTKSESKQTVTIQKLENQNPASFEYHTLLSGNQMLFKIQTIQQADNFQSSKYCPGIQITAVVTHIKVQNILKELQAYVIRAYFLWKAFNEAFP